MIFFRSSSVSEAVSIISKFFAFDYGFFVGQPSTFIYSVFAILVLMTVEFMNEFFPDRISRFESSNVVIRFASYATITILIIMIWFPK